MANTLLLNQNQIFNGLGTLTYTVPTGTVQQGYNVKVQVTFPEAVPINSNWSGNTAGAGANANAGQGYFGAGSASGLGAGTGGGGSGFVGGDGGTGHGGVGQGFGATNGYQQPPSAGSNITANSYVASSLSIVVNKNSIAQYTSTAPTQSQSALQFMVSLPAVSAADVVTVVLTSSAASDNQLNGVSSNVSINQGLL